MIARQQTVLSVAGMICRSCVRRVETALHLVEGVRRVEVRLRDCQVVVDHERREPSALSMVEALRAAGYAAAQDAQLRA